MSLFSNIILRALHDYKAVLRKNLPQSRRLAKLESLGLKRKQLYYADEVTLYHTAKKVVHDIEKRLINDSNMPSWHSGIDEFALFVKNMLAEYHIEGKKVIHTNQHVSNTILKAIQLMKLPEHKRTKRMVADIEACTEIIIKFGRKEQITIYEKALNTYKEQDTIFFTPLINHYHQALKQQVQTA